MNILITQDKNIKFLFKIYYFIFLLIVLSVLTSLIYTNTFYQKSYTQKVIPLNHAEKDMQVSYIIDLKTSKSLQQNELIYYTSCLLYTSPSPRDRSLSRMPSSA